MINEAHARGIKIIQDVVVNHSCQFGIRGKVWIDHLPMKYYVPQGSEQSRVNHGPYKGNLGNYAWPNRDDVDNPVAPEWYRERHARDPEGLEPLVDPKTGIIHGEAGQEIDEKLLEALKEAGQSELRLLDIDHINTGGYIRNTLAADKADGTWKMVFDAPWGTQVVTG